MSHKENDKIIDNVLDTLSEEDYDKYTSMTQDELIEIIVTHEDHHNEHHEKELELEKAKELYDLILGGILWGRIEDSDDGEFIPNIDPPELEKGLWVEPRLANKIREILKEEIDEQKSLYRY